MIRVLVVDDERPARDELCWLLQKHPDLEIVSEAENGMKALEFLETHEVDLVLLDIQMPVLSGLETARQILQKKKYPKIIFVTAYDQFAIEAFDVNAIDYLLKPIEAVRLDRALNRVRNRLLPSGDIPDLEERILSLFKNTALQGAAEMRKLTVYHDGRFIPIDFDKIIMMTAEEKFSRIYTEKGSYSYRKSLGDLESLVQGESLFKCHRSYTVNLDYLESVDPWFNNSYRLKLKDVAEYIPVSRSRASDLKIILKMD